METIPITDAKARIAELADRAEREHDHFTLTKNGRPTVMLLSVAEYESLMETLAVLADPITRADLVESATTEDFTDEETMAEIMRDRLDSHGAA
ncbi:type II toxin-antitoxin system Phd/YefM family antitoxin [Nocardia macrotermitis]|uniref:Antitoxin n=1 Tax=Nocardia macrotermitis TaxID=2585198 RepID=A0A7K0DD33_9NOCA|nr:type II toxin-antitoxin system Phd/YefM family antitoxin [Nocardia macrotermitis]MQY23529.1 Antitoxin RelF [Nocardia macrotermitis]